MQYRNIKIALITLALLLSDNLSVALETKPATDTKASSSLGTAEKGTKAKDAKAATPAKLVDINSAGKKELMTLPGIGEADADKIIAGRPYLTKAHLVTHNVLPRGVYENLKSLVIAKQKPDAPAKSGK